VIEISISFVYTLDLPDELPTPSTTSPATSPPASAASERRKAFMMRQLDVVDAASDESSAAVDCPPSDGACLKPPPAKPPRSFTASLDSSSLVALDTTTATHVDPLPSLSRSVSSPTPNPLVQPEPTDQVPAGEAEEASPPTPVPPPDPIDQSALEVNGDVTGGNNEAIASTKATKKKKSKTHKDETPEESLDSSSLAVDETTATHVDLLPSRSRSVSSPTPNPLVQPEPANQVPAGEAQEASPPSSVPLPDPVDQPAPEVNGDEVIASAKAKKEKKSKKHKDETPEERAARKLKKKEKREHKQLQREKEQLKSTTSGDCNALGVGIINVSSVDESGYWLRHPF